MTIQRDQLLSYSAASAARGRLEVRPSPAVELAYSTFFLSAAKGEGELSEFAWAREVFGARAEALSTLATFMAGSCRAGFELMVAVCRLGYVGDRDLTRFFGELPDMPARLLALLEDEDDAMDPSRDLGAQLTALREPAAMRRYSAALRAVWEVLEPYWQNEGETTVRRECARVERLLGEGSGVLSALPTHHFSRFEHSAAQISRHLNEGAVVITPLYFAAGGGFLIDVHATLFLGYGLHSDATYLRLRARAQRLAAKSKGFADPTRLMILALISKFELTVGDLVAQLEVSQPTVSGHLKLLKEEGLVTVRKEGTKAYYRVATAEVEALLEELRHLAASKLLYRAKDPASS